MSFLGQIQDFDRYKLREDLEQYITPPKIACEVLNWIQSEHEDILGKFVLDLGSGTGMLSLGCSFMGAAHVVGLEVDEEAMIIAQDNLEELGHACGSVDFVLCDVSDLKGTDFPIKVDTIVMNPPFGVHAVDFDYKLYRKQNRKHHQQKPRKNALKLPDRKDRQGPGIDWVFLQKASEMLSDSGSIYAFLLQNVAVEHEKHRKAVYKRLKEYTDLLHLKITSRQPIRYHLSTNDIEVHAFQFQKSS